MNKPPLKKSSISFLLVGFFLAFLFIPAVKISFEAYYMVRAASDLLVSIEKTGSTKVMPSVFFNSIEKHSKNLHREIRYFAWEPISRVIGKGEEFTLLVDEVTSFAEMSHYFDRIIGFQSPVKYLVIFQNPAEARGTGGIAGGYAVVEAKKGNLRVIEIGSNVKLKSMLRMPIKMPVEFTQNYGDDPAIWQNSNLSPHFPYAAQIWQALWLNQSDIQIDGVIAVDPIVLKSILQTTGPLTLSDGTIISSTNVVRETLSTAYERFDGMNEDRKDYLVQIASSVLKRLQDGGYSKNILAKNLIGPIREGRFLIYSSAPQVEAALATTMVGGSMNARSNDFRVVVQNIAGNKLDYYLKRTVMVTSRQCGNSPVTRVSVRITNAASKFLSLPAYVKGRLDIGMPEGKANSHKVSVYIYGPPGRELLSGDLVGDLGLQAFSGYELGRSYFAIPVELPAGGSARITADFAGSVDGVKITTQPLVISQTSKIANHC